MTQRSDATLPRAWADQAVTIALTWTHSVAVEMGHNGLPDANSKDRRS